MEVQKREERIYELEMTQSQAINRIGCRLPSLVSVPAGEFMMGCDLGRDDEEPVHEVYVNAFDMGTYTVTNEEYQLFIAQTNREAPESFTDKNFNNLRQPVVGVSWEDAVAYCQWLSRLTNLVYRLPTEAEWEWAVRENRQCKLYSWGDEDPSNFDLYRRGWQDGGPQAVGLQSPNVFGLYNLGDNVHEWCLDWYAPNYYQFSPFQNPMNKKPSSRRSSRGGSWRHHVKVSRCAARSSLHPLFKYADYGFRVVKVLS